MIHVVAVVTAKPGQRDRILEAFKGNAPAVRAERGCIEYVATVDSANAPAMQTPYGADTVVVVEKWADMGALEAHAAAPHMASYAARTKEFIASRTIHVLSPVEK